MKTTISARVFLTHEEWQCHRSPKSDQPLINVRPSEGARALGKPWPTSPFHGRCSVDLLHLRGLVRGALDLLERRQVVVVVELVTIVV